MFTTTYINIKKFVSEIFKSTQSGKPGVKEDPCVEVFVNTNIQYMYNLTVNPTPQDSITEYDNARTEYK